MRARALLLAALAPALGLAGCGRAISMNQQPKYLPQSPAGALPQDAEAQPPPVGTVPQGELAREAEMRTPPPVTVALVERGRERHDIFCRPCHGPTGLGDGVIVQRGFPRPLAYQDPRIKAWTGQQIYDAISNGYGVMYPQAERIDPADRWAIVAYVRAAQIAAPSPQPSSVSADQAPRPAP